MTLSKGRTIISTPQLDRYFSLRLGGQPQINKDHKNTLEVKAAKLGILVLTLMHPEVLIHFAQLILPLKITPKRITPWKVLPPRELSPRILPPSKLTPWKLSLVKLLPRKQSSMRWINISLKDIN